VLLITFGQSIGLPIPDWDTIGTATHLYDELTEDFSVHYIDVGKADAIYLHYQDFDMLIDAGVDSTSSQVNKYIRQFGIAQLDLVVATHPDKDHIGGMANIIEDFDIDLFWEPQLNPDIVPDTEAYRGMCEALASQSVQIEKAHAGISYDTDNISIDVLSPMGLYNSTNASSIVLKIKFGGTSFLFMGDAEQENEWELLDTGANISADILKIGHHGSKTSSTEEFLRAVNPQIAIISVGPDKNNLPAEIILNRLEELTIPYYRTDINGNIVIYSDGHDFNIQTEK